MPEVDGAQEIERAPEMKKVITHAEVSYECGHKVTVEVLKGRAFDVPDICERCRRDREAIGEGQG